MRQLVSGVVAACLAVGALVAAQPAAADPGTSSVDHLRTSWDSAQPRLTPADVTAPDFGQVFSTQLSGQIYAQPIIAGDTLVAATEANNVYGLDPVTGAVRWSRSIGPAWPASTLGCGDLTPTVGITSTPVYDPITASVFLIGKVNDGADARRPNVRLHKIDPATGLDRPGYPVTIGGSPSNYPGVTFNPMTAHQRTGLLLLDGAVYAGFGAHCAYGPYRGYVVGVSTTTGRQTTLWTSQAGSGSSGAGIWHSGGGIMSDGPGRMFVVTGNGAVAPPPGPGSQPPATLSESVIRLQVQPDGSLRASDFFSPANAPTLDVNDTDLASGGPVGLPDSFGTPSVPHLMVQQGKDGRLFLLDRDDLGGRMQGPGGTDDVVGVNGPALGQWGHPAVWGGDGGYLYVNSNFGPVRAYKRGVTVDGRPALSQVGTTRDRYDFGVGSPLVTSSGTTSGTATLWITTLKTSQANSGMLRAFDPIPDASGILREIWSAPIGNATKFTEPLSYEGRVYVGTYDGAIRAFGRPAATPITGSSTDLGSVEVGASVSGTVVLTAQEPVTVTGISLGAPFSVGSVTLPRTLAAGQELSVPVTFTPTGPGTATGILTAATTSGSFTFAVRGFATADGLLASPGSVSFVDKPAGTLYQTNVSVMNTGSGAETITQVTAPSAPFGTSGLPVAGTVVPPGGSFVAAVTFTPPDAGTWSGSITITSTSGVLTIPVSATAVAGSGRITFSPASLDFGNLRAGQTRTRTFDVINEGTIPATITVAKSPTGAFTADTPFPEGITIPPGQSVRQSVTFAPTVSGRVDAHFALTADTGQGSMFVPLTGVGLEPLPGPTSASWTRNGSAALSGSDLVLNPATASTRGSSWYPGAVPSSAFTARFTMAMGGGTGADGLTLAFADPTRATGTALGAGGGGLGLAGVPATAVAFKTTYTSSVASSNVGGIVTSTPGSSALTWSTTRALALNLRSGTHDVVVDRSGGRLAVSVDGVPVIDVALALPPTVLLGFTGASGSKYDQHLVRAVSIDGLTSVQVAEPLTATPTTLDLGSVPVGGSGTATVLLANESTVTQTVSGSSAPTGPFSAVLPAGGTTVVNGADVAVPVTFSPAAEGTFTSTLSVTTDGGTTSVVVTGRGTTSTTVVPPLVASPTSVAFGTVAVGSTASATVTITNPATTAQTVSARTLPGSPFTATLPAVGASIPAGGSVTVPVQFQPSAAGSSTSGLSITTAAGTVSVTLGGTGQTVGVGSVPAPTAGGWQLNGSAALSGTDLVLNPAATSTRGTAFWPTAIPSSAFTASFTSVIGGGTGADGLTLALVDATTGTATGLGSGGGGLGLGGLPATGVALRTTYSSVVKSSNVAGIVTAAKGTTALTWQQQVAVGPSLRSAPRAVVVTRAGGRLTVSVDGVQVLDAAVSLPPQILIGFTGASGTKTDLHAVRDVTITYG